MKALVINLDSSFERMVFQRNQLNKLNIGFQRLSAVSITNDKDTLYQKHYANWERPLSLSEVACFFSHEKAWKTVLKLNHPTLILEDDAYLSESVPCILDNLEKLNNVDYVTLEVTGTKKKKTVAKKKTKTICKTSLIRLYQGRSGAGGYVLWPSGARKLLAKSSKGRIGLADKFMNSCYLLNAYQIEPANIVQLDQCVFYNIIAPIKTKSSISTDFNLGLKFESCWKCRLRRIVGQVKSGLNQIRHLHHSTKRQIAISEEFKRK